MREYKLLTYEDRKKIEEMYSQNVRTLDIANSLGVHTATIYRELERGYTGTTDDNHRPGYSADVAEQNYQENVKRRGCRRAAVN